MQYRNTTKQAIEIQGQTIQPGQTFEFQAPPVPAGFEPIGNTAGSRPGTASPAPSHTTEAPAPAPSRPSVVTSAVPAPAPAPAGAVPHHEAPPTEHAKRR